MKLLSFLIFMYNCVITLYTLGCNKITFITIVDFILVIVSFICYWIIIEKDLKHD